MNPYSDDLGAGTNKEVLFEKDVLSLLLVLWRYGLSIDWQNHEEAK